MAPAKKTAAPQMKATPPVEAAPPAGLAVERVVAAINGADDVEAVDAVNTALYAFGAQDPSMQLSRSWARVQRRLAVSQVDGVATANQVRDFATRAGLRVDDAA